MVLPEGFQAVFLLNAANLSDDHQKLARATCAALTYKEMKSNILKFFCEFWHRNRDVSSSTSGTAIKTEPTYLAENDNEVLYSRNRGCGRDQSGYYRKKNFQNSSKFNRKGTGNPNGWKCFRCDSTDHLIRKCPILQREKGRTDANDVHITLFTLYSKTDSKAVELVRESVRKALLDCGCTKTVTGKLWLEVFLNIMLSDNERSKVIYELVIKWKST